MALSYVEYTSDGATLLYGVTFPYLDLSHIFVKANNAAYGGTFSFPSGTTILLSSPVPAGQRIRVYRMTPNVNPDVVFTGGTIHAADLNLNELQLLYITQEIEDAVGDANARAITVPFGEVGFSILPEATRAGTLQAYDSLGQPTAVSLPLPPIGVSTIDFDTQTLAGLATIPSGVNYIRTNGFAATNDGGAGLYARASSLSGRGGGFTSNGGTVKWALASVCMVPGHFGIFPSVTNNETRTPAMAAELTFRGNNGLTPWIEFPSGVVYPVYTSIPTTQSVLVDLRGGGSGLHYKMNGSRWQCTCDLLTTAVIVYAHYLRNWTDSVIQIGLTQTQSLNTVGSVAANPFQILGLPSDAAGINAVWLEDRCVNVDVQIDQLGGTSGLVIARQFGGPALQGDARCRNVTIQGTFKNVFYPFNPRNNGDNITGKIYAEFCARVTFFYNVSGIHLIVQQFNHIPAFDANLIKCYASALALDTQTSSVRLIISSRHNDNGASDDSTIAIAFDQQTTTYEPGELKDIHVYLDLDFVNTVNPGRVGLFIKSNGPLGIVNDSTNTAHIVEGVFTSGIVSGLSNSGTAPVIFDLFSNENWAGAIVRNSGLRNFTVKDSSGVAPVLNIDGRAFQAGFGFILDHVTTDGTSNFTNFGSGAGGLDVTHYISADIRPEFIVTSMVSSSGDAAFTIPVGAAMIIDSAALTADRAVTLPPGGVQEIHYARYNSSGGHNRVVNGKNLPDSSWLTMRRLAGGNTFVNIAYGLLP